MVSNLSFAVYAFALLGFLASSALCDNPCVAITRKCASTCTSTTTSSVKIGGVTTANWCVAFSLTPKNASGSIDWSSLNGNQAISGCVCNRGAGDYYVSTTSKPYLDASNNFYATSAANNSCGAAGNWWGIWGYTTTKSDTATFIVSGNQ
ncbi:hypothetical protein BJ742DRAFT_812516 [Cladochytrium replicatum]|nr:hypothetical protein BJ742DRAFT_812516 [Cladochytrium replicatum]